MTCHVPAVYLPWLRLLGTCASIRPRSERAAASVASSRLSASTSLVPWPRRHTPSRCCTASTSTVSTSSPPTCVSRKVAPPTTGLPLVSSLTPLAASASVPAAASSAASVATAARSRSSSVRLLREKSRWCRCASRLIAVEHGLKQRRLRPGLTAPPRPACRGALTGSAARNGCNSTGTGLTHQPHEAGSVSSGAAEVALQVH